ncbi:hypothetical protein N7450_008174 [Penicillium hetheringtonii]|uniref:Ras guanyl-nucleotide exchange factor RasGEF n=1 Tax=Penicillium hetheringtonii TaxID=911720 RepID=A0AAD6GNV9_9EURO|nr:hypothetical protein N7450_008174 [Penicillium hetheringtonii]
MSSQARRERALSDRIPPQRPGMGSRTSSAPAGGLYKLDPSRRSAPNVGNPLMEEDEASPGESNNMSKRSHSRQPGDEGSVKSSPPEVTIAVVGEDNAGKTSFIKCALDMKVTPSSLSTKKKMSLDGSVYMVRLLEVDLRQVFVDENNVIVWPQLEKDSAPPMIDGVLLLHDATRSASFDDSRELIVESDALDAPPTSLPLSLVACKCDLQPEDSQLAMVHERHEIYRTSPESSRSQQMCIALVLRDVISHRRDLAASSDRNPNPSASPAPPRTTTKSFQPTPPHGQYNHARTNSSTPTAVLTGAAGGSISSVSDRVDGNGGHRFTQRPDNPFQSGATACFQFFAKCQDFLNMEDEIDNGQTMLPDNVVRPKPSSESNSSADSGFSFDELVDRLVAEPMSKNDSKFVSIFLCLYRKFASPGVLLSALITRFEKNEANNTDQLARMADQLRLLNVISLWASDYAGDFAHPKTRKRINDFVANLEKSHFYMFAAKEISSFLDTNAEDDDMGWVFSDGDGDDSGLTETFLDNSGRSSPAPFQTGTYDDDEHDEEEEDPIYSMSNLDLSDGPHDSTSRLSGTLSISSNTDKPSSTANQSFSLLTVEASQKEALRLELSSRTILTKIQWRYFMETPDEDFARELTRIDWIMYNSFGPRDLVRHVSISGVDKDKVKSLQNVNRMIRQFNHLAFFVASMILLRDKPKHRARCLEKFMTIAVKLRRQNNYNSLGALIAGINGTPSEGLYAPGHLDGYATKLLCLSSGMGQLLYGTHSFPPLHRRDLVSAEEGNKTFVGENKSRINWKKFEVMGEVVLGIQRSQKMPHPQAQKFDDIERMILDAKLSGDEEALYARSLQVEPSTGSEPNRKKFGWLRA